MKKQLFYGFHLQALRLELYPQLFRVSSLLSPDLGTTQSSSSQEPTSYNKSCSKHLPHWSCFSREPWLTQCNIPEVGISYVVWFKSTWYHKCTLSIPACQNWLVLNTLFWIEGLYCYKTLVKCKLTGEVHEKITHEFKNNFYFTTRASELL